VHRGGRRAREETTHALSVPEGGLRQKLKILMDVIPTRVPWHEIIANAIHEEVNKKEPNNE
jgi:hypothetical protein